MKTISISTTATELNSLLDQARQEDLVVRTPDGAEFVVSALENMDEEIARTRKNQELMAELDQRARQAGTVPLDEVKRRLGLL